MPVFGMFGLYRYVLASLVVISHFLPYTVLGVNAVYGFFILSGYVVSYILSCNYLPLEGGKKRYGINRFLRIYPAYWLALLIVIALAWEFPDVARDINVAIWIPKTTWQWITNLTTFGLVNILGMYQNPQLLVVAWSLGVEMLYWALMPYFLESPGKRRAFIVFAVVYTVAVAILSAVYGPLNTISLRHPSPLAGALPFCIGMLYLRGKVQGRVTRCGWFYGVAVACTWVIGFFIIPMRDPEYFAGYYTAMLANALVIYGLMTIDVQRLPAKLVALDHWLGDISYPLFLLHIPVGIALHAVLPLQPFHGWVFCLMGLLLATFAASLFHIVVERPINRIRQRIKFN